MSILTPASPGAIAVLLLDARDAESLALVLDRASTPIPVPNSLRVGLIAGVDHGVIARFSPTTVHLMPHAGPAIVAEIARRLQAAGAQLILPADLDPRSLYPEATDLLEARMLAALSTAASPLAIELLLDQPRRWRAFGATSRVPRVAARSDQCVATDRGASHSAILNRLLTPPLVAAYGPPNIGKSTLCNALAGRAVAIVADEPGTTRDHVGVMLELGGLVVRYVDTPGMAGGSAVDGPRSRAGAPASERDAVAITRSILRSADLIVRCGDCTAAPLPLPPGTAPAAGTIDVALRTDLGLPTFPREVDLAAAMGRGVDALAAAIRERLVSAAALEDPCPWAFWSACLDVSAPAAPPSL